ncbi:hypothetical protein ACWGJB_23880, partial [Streptomyces sp. NPDC054813]
MDDQALVGFLGAAVGEYQLITAEAPLPCFALLLGSAEATTYHVQRIAFGRNARTSDPAARQEFSETIVPKFGPAYENEHRGWWMDSHDLLQASHEADALGMDLLGSIHMHPDWHRLGPPAERGGGGAARWAGGGGGSGPRSSRGRGAVSAEAERSRAASASAA